MRRFAPKPVAPGRGPWPLPDDLRPFWEGAAADGHMVDPSYLYPYPPFLVLQLIIGAHK